MNITKLNHQPNFLNSLLEEERQEEKTPGEFFQTFLDEATELNQYDAEFESGQERDDRFEKEALKQDYSKSDQNQFDDDSGESSHIASVSKQTEKDALNKDETSDFQKKISSLETSLKEGINSTGAIDKNGSSENIAKLLHRAEALLQGAQQGKINLSELKQKLMQIRQEVENLVQKNGRTINQSPSFTQKDLNQLKGILEKIDLNNISQSSIKETLTQVKALLQNSESIQKKEIKPDESKIDTQSSRRAEKAEAREANPLKNNQPTNSNEVKQFQNEGTKTKTELTPLGKEKGNESSQASNSLQFRESGLIKQDFQTHLSKAYESNSPVLDHKHLISRMVQNVKMAVTQGQEQVTVKLYPESLGKVSVVLEKTDGMFSAKLYVDNNAIKELIETKMQDLKDHLNQAGIQFDQVDVDLSDNSKQKGKGVSDFKETKDTEADVSESEWVEDAIPIKRLNPNGLLDLTA